MNVWIPKYISQARLSIESVKALPDSIDLSLEDALYRQVLHIRPAQFLPLGICFTLLNRNAIDRKCVRELLAAFRRENKRVENDIKIAEERIEELKHVKQLDELREVVSSDLVSILVFIEGVIKPEAREQVLEMFVFAKRKEETDRLQRMHDYKSPIKEIIDVFESRLADASTIRSGKLAIEVIILNVGGADALVYPSATLEITDSTTLLRQARSWRDLFSGQEIGPNYTIIRANTVRKVLYSVDESRTPPEDLQRLQWSLSKNISTEFTVILETADDEIRRRAYLPETSVSFSRLANEMFFIPSQEIRWDPVQKY